VREFGGDLRAENRPEGGARFILQLPAAPGENAHPDADQ
jgi:C4-dicarboxylate-specific signal transduction histidine kinase